MHGSDRVPDLNIDYKRAWVGRAKATASTRAKWRSSTSAWLKCARKLLGTADIVRDAILQQSVLTKPFFPSWS
jgi:hypothetical protein